MCHLAPCTDRQALEKIQRNLRKWLQTKDWAWAKLFTKIRPQLKSVNMEEEMRRKQEAYEKTKAELDDATKTFKALEVSTAAGMACFFLRGSLGPDVFGYFLFISYKM